MWRCRYRASCWTAAILLGFTTQSVCAADGESEPSNAIQPTLTEETSFTITFDKDAPRADQRVSGFLSLINSNTPDPPTDLVLPLRPQIWKNAYHTNYERITTDFQCPTVITTLSEHWGMPDRSPPPWLDDEQPDWSTWNAFCRHHVNVHLDQGFNPVWNIWNEPDGGNRWWHGPRGYANLAETYRHAYQSIRSAYLDHSHYSIDDMVVAAPGFADWGNAYGFHSGLNYWTGELFEPDFAGFLQFCADESLECHVIMWHEFWEDYVFYIPTKAAVMQSLVDEYMAQHPHINVQRYYLDEIIHAEWPYPMNYHLSPGHVATVLSLIESAGIDGAVRAVWGDRHGFSGNINHSVCSLLDVKYCEDPPGNPVLWPPPSSCHEEPYAPRSQYWVHWYYAQFDGPVARVEASYPVQAGYGTYDPAREVYQVLLGYSLSYGFDGNGNPLYGYGTTRTTIQFTGLPIGEESAVGTARLRVLEIPPSGWEPLPEPVTLVDRQPIVFRDGVFDWTLADMRRGHAYVIELSDVKTLSPSPAPRKNPVQSVEKAPR